MTTAVTLYKRDTTGKIRTWRQEIDGDKYRTISGIHGGTETESGWTVATAKNVGQSNETTPEQQAVLEVEAEYRKKLELAYFVRIEDVDNDRFYQPMLAHKYEGWEAGSVVCSQPKLDGIRCIATKDGLYSRKGKAIVAVPHIMKALEGYFTNFPNHILDGELYNHDLKDNFNKITSVVKKLKPSDADLVTSENVIQYHIYDVDAGPGVTFVDRNTHLTTYAFAWINHLVIVPTAHCSTETHLDEMYGSYLEQGYEGQIVRAAHGLYENKRSKNLLKRKEFKDAEFKVLAVEEGLGNWAGVAKKVTLELPDGRTFGAGIKGTREDALTILQQRDKFVGTLATVRYFTETPDGIPRFPVVYELDRSH